MKKVKIENAVGMVLAHDVTRIIPGKFKGVGFKKGHVVREEDIPELIKMGKRHLYALDLSEDRVHEDDAALQIARAISGDLLRWTDPREGKSNIVGKRDGLLKVNTAGLLKINKMGNIIVSTLKTNFPCNKGQTVAGTRIIPLTISKKKMERLEIIAGKFNPILQILPYRRLKVGVVVTGTEVFDHVIHDGFDEQVGPAIKSHGAEIVKKILVPDEANAIVRAIREHVDGGCDIVVTTGGLSVDPDDVTRLGVQRTGARIISYGAPVLPGAMFLYAMLDDVPILGLPACVYYHRTTIFNLVFPRILAGEELTKNDIARLGHGGLCMNCEVCRHPVCPFGK
ncbi:MAG: molybdopterin-binding protein [Desulfobacterales bacterium]|nr:molybdopterin-binding protein [Desulfobacterales bacterium]